MNQIVPDSQTTTITTTGFTVTCRNVNLFENASFMVDTFDVNGVLLNRQVLTMTNQQYLEWNNNDSYVVQWVATTLGYTLVPTPEAPVEPSV